MSVETPSSPKEFQISRMVLVGICVAVFVAALLAYLLGVSDQFILDDSHNLSPIAHYPELPLLERFFHYVSAQIAGPTGRPVAAITFFLNSTDWPTSAVPFKQTNIVIHLVTGAAIMVLSNLLLIALKMISPGRRHLLAIVIGAIWLLHPLHVSTTLYVVQRMTQLYTLFLISAAALYVHLRLSIHTSSVSNTNISPKIWIGLWAGCGSLAALAIGSKETAIIFPLLIIALDATILAGLQWPSSRGKLLWRTCALALPLVALGIFIAKSWPNNQIQFAIHNFDLVERLLTQPRVLLDYAGKILVPRLSGLGLYHDDFVISRGLFNPASTAVAIAAVIGLSALAVVFRRRSPAIAFGVLWFLGGHVLEASVLPIEIYFEHRNYLPSFGLIFAVAVLASQLLGKNRMVQIAAPAAVLLFLGGLSVQNTLSWKNPVRQAAIWAAEHPDSYRARLKFSHLLRRAGFPDKAVTAMDPAKFSKPDALYYIAQTAVACLGKQQPQRDWASSAMAHVNPERVWRWLPSQVEQIAFAAQNGDCTVSPDSLIELLDAHARLPMYASHSFTHYELHAVKQRILAQTNRVEEAAATVDRMIQIIPKPGAFLAKARLHARLGNVAKASKAVSAGLARIEQIGTQRAEQLVPDFRVARANIEAIQKAIDKHQADTGPSPQPDL